MKKTNFEYIKKILHPVKFIKIKFLGLTLYALYRAIFPISLIYIMKIATDAIAAKEISLLYNVSFVYLIYVIIYFFIFWLLRNYITNLRLDIKKNILYPQIFKKFVLLNNNAVENKGTGNIIPIIEKGIDNWSYVLTELLSGGFKEFFGIIFGIITLYFLIPKYFLIGIFVLVFFMFFGNYINKFALKYRKEARDMNNLQTSQMVKIIMSKFEILQNDKIDKELGVLYNYNQKEKLFAQKVIFWSEIMFTTPWILSHLFRVGLILFVGLGVIKGHYSIGTFVALSTVIMNLTVWIDNSLSFYRSFTQSSIHIDKLLNFLDETPEIIGYKDGSDFVFKKGDILIKNLMFGYGDKKIFENFDLKINGSQKTAIVGKSGGGKTTLVKLLSGFLRPEKGEIIIDGQRLEDISLKSYYKNIGYLTQEPSIFDGTIIDNLTYGLFENVSLDKVKEAIKMAECEFIWEFDKGLETEIGERGIKLSGGQRQRLAIAKIFLKNPKILFLDEPTSSLDSFSEEKITKALHNLFVGRTVIVIAHRLQTVKESNEIIVIDGGNVVEIGNHESLLQKGGIYSKMVDLQSGLIS